MPVEKANDMTGRQFSMLTVEERAERPEGKEYGGSWWRCRCECGNTLVVARTNLVSGHVKSCGCLRSKMQAERNRRRQKPEEVILQEMRDIVGKTIGSLQVGELVPRPEGATQYRGKKHWYRCTCVCGKEVVVARQYLRETQHPSCGCQAAKWQRHVRSIGKRSKDLLIAHEQDPEVREARRRRNEVAEELHMQIHGKDCARCKKRFDCYAGDQWAYKFQHKGKIRYFCSYGCMRKYEQAHMQRPMGYQYL